MTTQAPLLSRASASRPNHRRLGRWITPAWFVATVICLAACQGTTPTRPSDSPAARYANPIERAHSLGAWRGTTALASDIVVRFGGQTMLDGKLLMETNSGRSRIELKDGTTLVFDGSEAWVSPASSSSDGARFHLLTWPYFIAAPMKLRDPGSTLTPMGQMQLAGNPYDTARLTFDPGVGDTPDDWYLTYAHPNTHRLHAMAYIVTYGKKAQEAEKEPHAITFDGFETINGVTLSTRWLFWHWSSDRGIHGDPIGDATLSNLRFVTPEKDAFTRPADARRDDLPPPG